MVGSAACLLAAVRLFFKKDVDFVCTPHKDETFGLAFLGVHSTHSSSEAVNVAIHV